MTGLDANLSIFQLNRDSFPFENKYFRRGPTDGGVVACKQIPYKERQEIARKGETTGYRNNN